MKMLATEIDQLFNYGDNFTPENLVMGAILWLIRQLLLIRTYLSLYLHCPKGSTPSEHIEGHMSVEVIDTILDNPGKPGTERIGVQVA
jgi:hypothetical protein